MATKGTLGAPWLEQNPASDWAWFCNWKGGLGGGRAQGHPLHASHSGVSEYAFVASINHMHLRGECPSTLSLRVCNSFSLSEIGIWGGASKCTDLEGGQLFPEVAPRKLGLLSVVSVERSFFRGPESTETPPPLYFSEICRSPLFSRSPNRRLPMSHILFNVLSLSISCMLHSLWGRHCIVKDLRDILDVPTDYKVIFTQGGATLQFAAIPLNMMGEKTKAWDRDLAKLPFGLESCRKRALCSGQFVAQDVRFASTPKNSMRVCCSLCFPKVRASLR